MRSTLSQSRFHDWQWSRTGGLAVCLVGFVSLAACTKSTTPPRAATGSSSGTVSLELEKGPAPALPNPMLVTDSVHGGVFESCYQGFHATGNAERDLAQMTSLCGPPNSMKPVTGVIRGNQAHQEAIARFTFRGEMGRCYRIFSASDRGVQDMDLAMLDPDKNVVGHD